MRFTRIHHPLYLLNRFLFVFFHSLFPSVLILSDVFTFSFSHSIYISYFLSTLFLRFSLFLQVFFRFYFPVSLFLRTHFFLAFFLFSISFLFLLFIIFNVILSCRHQRHPPPLPATRALFVSAFPPHTPSFSLRRWLMSRYACLSPLLSSSLFQK